MSLNVFTVVEKQLVKMHCIKVKQDRKFNFYVGAQHLFRNSLRK